VKMKERTKKEKNEDTFNEVLDLVDTETKKNGTEKKHAAGNLHAVALSSDVGSLSALQSTVLENISKKQASILGLRNDPLRHGRKNASSVVAVRTGGLGARVRRNKLQHGTAWIHSSLSLNKEREEYD
jgi:hypothetical protein